MTILRRTLLGLLAFFLVSAGSWALPLHAATLASVPEQGITHTVQAGENLFRISLRYGTTVDAIMAANGLSSIYIYVGQELVIPTAGETAATPEAPPQSSGAEPASGDYVVQAGDTLSGIAVRYGVSLWTLIQANGLTSWSLIYVGQSLTIPGMEGPSPNIVPNVSGGETYVVRAGDTLTSIAQRYGTTVVALANLNGIANPSSIYVGQTLKLSGTPPPVPAGGGKRIVVDLSEQHLYAYAGNQLVYSFIASSGAAPYYTRVGTFQVQSKFPNAYGSTWNIWMPYWLGIYYAGSTENGIHALPVMSNGQTLWAGYLGTPVSYGCIVLGTYEAQLLYEWADYGTPVIIQY